jgi:subtilisin family serine protease
MAVLRWGFFVGVLSTLALVAGAQARPRPAAVPLVEVVVALDGAPLADLAPPRRLAAVGEARPRRLSLHSPASVSRLRTLTAAQLTVQGRIEAAIPGADVRWRYRIVANGLAVVLPRSHVSKLTRIQGVEAVYPSVAYRPALDRAPQQIGAPALWGPGLTGSTGAGIKIGIIDQGVDAKHVFFNPAGYAMPAGFPKGQTQFTNAKVIVARAFPPAGADWEGASLPYHGDESAHGTHVAGIAAGNADTIADTGVSRPHLSGVAPRAYIGNYNALTVPSSFGLNGNSPELVAAIEQAVADGMDVLNLSLQEAEIEPSRDIVALALDKAARAGVVPVVAAGNSFDELGNGSVGSPASASRAITAGAVTTSRGATPNRIAGFSSAGPTQLSLRLKPDVSAPGVNILSSVPEGWDLLSGTSMASPMVAGAAALLRQHHPDWSVEQLKSALATTGSDAIGDAPVTRQGGGVVNLPLADVPRLFASPTSLTLGLLRRGTTAARTVTLTDAGGGAGPWNVRVDTGSVRKGLTLSASGSTVTVPGRLTLRARATTAAAQGEVSGRLVLTRGTDVRRLDFWLRVTAPALPKPTRTLTAPGLYRGSTKGRPARVSAYRYPERPAGTPFATVLRGPEQVFRVRLRRPAANLGVAIVSRAPGVKVEPRLVAAGDENRLTGLTALPFDVNPYGRDYGGLVLASAAIAPRPGSYDVVFDSATKAGAGAFTFRLWLDDRTPPTVVVASRTARRGAPLVVRLRDAGSGVDPHSIRIAVDGRTPSVPRFAAGRISVPTAGLAAGRHSLRVEAADYQETRNMENVRGVLPNTRVLQTSFVVRG